MADPHPSADPTTSAAGGCRLVPLSPSSIGTQALAGTPGLLRPAAGQHA
jgi:hypothetical protein